MKQIYNRIPVLFILSIFVVSMMFLPGFTTKAISADSTTTSDASTAPAGSGAEGEGATSGAGSAGAEGGEAVFAGLTTGTIVIGVVVVAAGIGIIAAISGGSSTSHPSTTAHH